MIDEHDGIVFVFYPGLPHMLSELLPTHVIVSSTATTAGDLGPTGFCNEQDTCNTTVGPTPDKPSEDREEYVVSSASALWPSRGQRA